MARLQTPPPRRRNFWRKMASGSDFLKTFAVVTSIQRPTHCMVTLSEKLGPLGIPLLLIGDKKGPDSFELPGSEFFNIDSQLAVAGLTLPSLLPTGHYCRKNVGYLVSMSRGAQRIYETDDDNAPLSSWSPREEMGDVSRVEQKGWCNVYRLFSDSDLIWPRGLPLDKVKGSPPAVVEDKMRARCPIQQGQANGAPDVDAIWRLLVDRDFHFSERDPLVLRPNVWCPFNSQNTWWFPIAFPLMYLPSYCSFRMTDIWRSFIAQRCLWELDLGVEFHSADVLQDRNAHNLMRDFTDEIPGYTRNAALCATLESVVLQSGEDKVCSNLLACYRALVEAEYFPSKELQLVEAWICDFEVVCGAK